MMGNPNGGLIADLQASTFDVGMYPGWQNTASNGFLYYYPYPPPIAQNPASSPTTIDQAVAHLPVTYGGKVPGGTYTIIGDYTFSNSSCVIYLDPGVPAYGSGTNSVYFYGLATDYNVLATPWIDSVTPSQLIAGVPTPVTITGSGFGSSSGNNVLALCFYGASSCDSSDVNVTVNPATWTDTHIDAVLTAPASSTSYYEVQVKVNPQQSNYAYAPMPQGQSKTPSNRQGPLQACAAPYVSIVNRPMTISGSFQGSYPYTATLSVSSSAGSITWSTDSPATISFSPNNEYTTRASINGPGRAKITATLTNSCGTAQDSFTFVLSDDITVIGWIDGSQLQEPIGADPNLAAGLNTPAVCSAILGSWAVAGQGNGIPQLFPVTADADRRYANFFLLSHSANPTPPSSLLDPDGFSGVDTNYRAFNRFQTYFEIGLNNTVNAPTVGYLRTQTPVGRTLDPCGLVPAVSAEANSQNGTRAGRASYVFQLNEGRVGTLGQQVNTYLNSPNVAWPQTTPWIWSAIEIDVDGHVLPLQTVSSGFPTAQIFPTYFVYKGTSLIQTITQSPQETFIALDWTSSFQIPPLP
jgi:hypothetical protein